MPSCLTPALRVRTALMVAATLAAAGPAAAQTGPSAKPLSPDECAMTVVLGKQVLGWGKTAPDISQFPVFYRPFGGGAYVEQCPWVQLGITPLPPGKPDFTVFRFFTAPKYSEDGKTASLAFVTRLRIAGRPPSVQVQECNLSKTDGKWRFNACVQGSTLG